MKRLTNLCLIILLILTAVFCMTACNGDGEQTVTYEITVETNGVSVDMSAIKVRMYPLDGSEGSFDAQLIDGKAKFELQADSYVATVSGLDEKVSFSSLLLTKNSRKATITVSNSKYDDLMDYYSYSFTVILQSGDYKLSEVSAQICDLDLMCIDEDFEQGNVVDFITNGGECSIEVFVNNIEKYNETFTVDLDMRFHIVRL